MLNTPHPPNYTLFPYTTLFRSVHRPAHPVQLLVVAAIEDLLHGLTDLVLSRLHVGVDLDAWRSRCVLDVVRSEEHTSELQSRRDLVCRLLLEKKKNFILTTVY